MSCTRGLWIVLSLALLPVGPMSGDTNSDPLGPILIPTPVMLPCYRLLPPFRCPFSMFTSGSR